MSPRCDTKDHTDLDPAFGQGSLTCSQFRKSFAFLCHKQKGARSPARFIGYATLALRATAPHVFFMPFVFSSTVSLHFAFCFRSLSSDVSGVGVSFSLPLMAWHQITGDVLIA